MKAPHPKQDIYDKADTERGLQTQDILNSKEKKKVIVAGPGTGKTHLFQKLLKTKSKNSLTLTFVNALIDDLSLSLLNLSEVRTLHGYALKVLGEEGIKLFPKLPKIIEEDAKILTGQKIDTQSLFNAKSVDEKILQFYKQRRNYYGNYYGYSDVIYELVEFFKNPKNKIPAYDQILVDEFQDFNDLEVELIELLARQSPILIAGDDDQSLYIEIKDATPEHLRKKHNDKTLKYKNFPLSFCSRSTEVIVDSINDFIATAVNSGFLKGRVPKLYHYFPNEKMDEEGAKHPRVIFRPVISKFLSEFFEEEILKIAEIERKPFDILIIVPNILKPLRFPLIEACLRNSGFRNVNFSKKTDKGYTLIEGFTLLAEDSHDNLGWRIVVKHMLGEVKFKEILEKTAPDNSPPIQELVEQEFHSEVNKFIQIFKKIISNEEVEGELINEFFNIVKYKPQEIAVEKFREDFYSSKSGNSLTRAVRDIKITITTVMGSKGLAADYVFLMDFSDKYFSKGGITDQNIYDFIVAMTRARKRIYLISPDDKEATFLGWIKNERIKKEPAFLRKKFDK